MVQAMLEFMLKFVLKSVLGKVALHSDIEASEFTFPYQAFT